MATTYKCPRCGFETTTSVNPKFIKNMVCGGDHEGYPRHVKPAEMEKQ